MKSKGMIIAASVAGLLTVGCHQEVPHSGHVYSSPSDKHYYGRHSKSHHCQSRHGKHHCKSNSSKK